MRGTYLSLFRHSCGKNGCFEFWTQKWIKSQHFWKTLIWTTDGMWSIGDEQNRTEQHKQTPFSFLNYVRCVWLSYLFNKKSSMLDWADKTEKILLLKTYLSELKRCRKIYGSFLLYIVYNPMTNTFHYFVTDSNNRHTLALSTRDTFRRSADAAFTQKAQRVQHMVSCVTLSPVGVYWPVQWKHFDKTIRWSRLEIELTDCQVTRGAGATGTHKASRTTPLNIHTQVGWWWTDVNSQQKEEWYHLLVLYFRDSFFMVSQYRESNLPSSSLIMGETFRRVTPVRFIKTRLLLVGCIMMSISTTFTSVSHGSLLFTGNTNYLNTTKSSASTPDQRYPCYLCWCFHLLLKHKEIWCLNQSWFFLVSNLTPVCSS